MRRDERRSGLVRIGERDLPGQRALPLGVGESVGSRSISRPRTPPRITMDRVRPMRDTRARAGGLLCRQGDLSPCLGGRLDPGTRPPSSASPRTAHRDGPHRCSPQEPPRQLGVRSPVPGPASPADVYKSGNRATHNLSGRTSEPLRLAFSLSRQRVGGAPVQRKMGRALRKRQPAARPRPAPPPLRRRLPYEDVFLCSRPRNGSSPNPYRRRASTRRGRQFGRSKACRSRRVRRRLWRVRGIQPRHYR